MRVVVGAPILGTLVGRMNRSAIISSPPPELVQPIPIALGSDRNNIERIALLFRSNKGSESEPCCLFLSNIEMNHSRLSEMKQDERRDLSSSSWKCGVVRYVVCSVNEPRRCGTGGKVWVLVGNGECWVGESHSSENGMWKSAQNNERRNRRCDLPNPSINFHEGSTGNRLNRLRNRMIPCLYMTGG
jgi:hypothetical protein